MILRDFKTEGPIDVVAGQELDSLNAALPHLRRPFAPAAVRWKVQSAGDGWGLVVAYIDSRLVIERLNLVVGGAWGDEYKTTAAGHEECALTVFGVTRRDVGQGSGPQAVKGARSDARKRAGVLFGVGVSIYALKSVMMDATKAKQPEGNRLLVKNAERGAQGKKHWTAQLSPAAERWLAAVYERWLTDASDGRTTGEDLFGAFLDHGDEVGAAGVEGADEAGSSVVDESEPAASAQIEGEAADALRATATEHYQAIRKMNAAAIPPRQHRVQLEQAGAASLEALEEYAGKLAAIRVNMEEERAK